MSRHHKAAFYIHGYPKSYNMLHAVTDGPVCLKWECIWHLPLVLAELVLANHRTDGEKVMQQLPLKAIFIRGTRPSTLPWVSISSIYTHIMHISKNFQIYFKMNICGFCNIWPKNGLHGETKWMSFMLWDTRGGAKKNSDNESGGEKLLYSLCRGWGQSWTESGCTGPCIWRGWRRWSENSGPLCTDNMGNMKDAAAHIVCFHFQYLTGFHNVNTLGTW